mgnify:FL=1
MFYFDINCLLVILGIIRLIISMYQTIHEPIRVAGVFDKAHFVPRWFEWGQLHLNIEKITLVSDYKQGLLKSKSFSVLAAGNLYRLVFNLNTLDWMLDAIWIDG